MVAIDEGSPPGVHPSTVTIDGGKVMIAGASHGPWVDLNLWLFNYGASVAHGHPVTLAYQPEMSVRDGRLSLLPEGRRALAVAEAAMFGGSWVLSLDDGLRLGLYQQDPKALRDWGTITAYRTFFTQHFRNFGSPLTNVAVIIDNLGETSEVMNLMARKGIQYRALSVDDISSVSPALDNLVVCVNLGVLPRTELRRLLEYVKAGGIAVTNPPNLPEGSGMGEDSITRNSEVLTEYSIGAGKWIVYKEAISDPDEFSRDVLKALPFSKRWIRLWNAATVFARTAQVPGSTRRTVQLINYEMKSIEELQVQVKGIFRSIRVFSPDNPETLIPKGLSLNPVIKEGFTEFLLPRLDIYSLLILE